MQDLRVERGASVGDAVQRGDEVLELGQPVFEKVAEPFGALGDEAVDTADLDLLGEDQDPDSGGWRARISYAARSPSSVCVGGIRMSRNATGRGEPFPLPE